MTYTIKLPQTKYEQPEKLPFEGINPKTGEKLGVTRQYFTKNDQPWYPIMGEFHFSRYPEAYWEEEILKMKAGGIQIIATYIFWIHHEEIEGQWDWTGQRELRKFIEICDKCGVYTLLRLGPWNHGECRNGGFPDWLVEADFELRSDNEGYLAKAKRFYEEIFQQAQGLLFKDGGPVIGIQIENEYGHCGGFQGEKGMQHMRTLTNMAKEIGFEVPYYTATGWGGAVLGDNLPVMGAYADAPWDRSVEQLPLSENFLFSNDRNDEGIGSDFVDDNSMYSKNYTFNPNDYPYATAELGGGIMVTKHRRPIIKARDTESMVFTRIGSGANLIGYYMYHGGTNPEGKLTTLQEKKPRDWCDLPIKSYDFQGVIGEYGMQHSSYHALRIHHMFLADFGSRLATMTTYFPEFNATDPSDTQNLRISVRHNGHSGFVFLNNYQRHLTLPDRNGIELEIDLGETKIKYPKINLENGQNIAFPFNLEVGGTIIEYATGQPLCLLNDDTIVFWNHRGYLEIKIDGEIYRLNFINKPELVIGNLHVIILSAGGAEEAWKLTHQGTHELAYNNWILIEDGEGHKQIWETPEEEGPTFELLEERENGDKFYKIDLPELFLGSERDTYLVVNFAGNIANLFFDGKLVADWFYTGLPWEIGLKRFKDQLQHVEITLQIKPLREGDPIYLEKPPVYENGVACRLEKLELLREYEKRYTRD